MAWHPRLVVRLGRGGSIVSPTSDAGYVLFASISAVIACGMGAAVLSGNLVFLLGLLPPAFFLRDAWAWFAASPAEREAFLAEVARERALGRTPPPNEVQLGEGWGPATLVALVLGAALSYGALALGHLVFFIPAMFLTAFALLAALDLVRAHRGR